MSDQVIKNKKISLLVCDDHPLMRAGLCEAIDAQCDMEVVGEACNGQEAVAAFLIRRPDITIMDVVMPGLDGFAALEQIRQEDQHARIIMLSAYKYEIQIRRAFQAGASGFLLKSTACQDFLAGIRNVYQGLPCIPAEIAAQLTQNMWHEMISRRETQVLQYIAQGNSNKQVARKLDISEETVKAHVKSILPKLGAADRTHAVTIALRRGIIVN